LTHLRKLEIPELTQDNMPVLRTSSTIPVRLYPPDLFKRIRDSWTYWWGYACSL